MNKLFKKNTSIIFILCSIMLCIFCSCNSEEISKNKLRDLDFTVVEQEDIPEELTKIIDEKKENPFKLSYANSNYLYIVEGYGKQQTGGYSIQINELYETDNAIYIHTTLLGPSKDEQIEQAITYPYVVAKIEFLEKNVVFE